MNDVIYLILRQMRRPALILIGTYSVAVLGMSSIPMVGENGKTVHLSIFQAFYWVSYTATTIGYGEVPVPFSQWQRIWVAISIYYTVPAWLYAAGKIIALMQDPTFQHALEENRFARRVARQREDFVIVCGFGEAGQRLVDAFLADGCQCVVIEQNQNRVNRMVLDAALHRVLAIQGNATDVALLEKAGIGSPYCRAVMAMTDDEDVNIKVALTARLLSGDCSRFKVVCRTFSREGSANAKSFATDIVVDSSQLFAESLIIGLRRPSIAKLLSLMLGQSGSVHEYPLQPPRGHWIICGYNHFGRTLARFLDYEGIDTTVVDTNVAVSERYVQGTGMEAVTLRDARIDRATAIVAGRSNDTDNLSIVMTAKALVPSLFVVGKQNRSRNHRLFCAAGFDCVMAEAALLTGKIFPQVARPLLGRFLAVLRHQDEAWGSALLAQIEALSARYVPYQYLLQVDMQHAPAIVKELESGHLLRLQSLWMHPHHPHTQQDAIAVLLLRHGKEILLPQPATALQKGDHVLILYHHRQVERRIHRAAIDEGELFYAIHGKEKPRSFVMNYIFNKWD